MFVVLHVYKFGLWHSRLHPGPGWGTGSTSPSLASTWGRQHGQGFAGTNWRHSTRVFISVILPSTSSLPHLPEQVWSTGNLAFLSPSCACVHPREEGFHPSFSFGSGSVYKVNCPSGVQFNHRVLLMCFSGLAVPWHVCPQWSLQRLS